MKFDFKTNKSEDMVLIDMNSWIGNDSNLVQTYRMSGRQIPTYITKVLDSNIVSEKYKEERDTLVEGTYILLTRAVSEIADFRSYKINNRKYYNAPIPHIIGYFENNKITIDSLKLTQKKVIVEAIRKESKGILQTSDESTTIGKVIKIGKGIDSITTGDIVLLKDNVSTPIIVEGQKYHAIEETDVVGTFTSDNYTIDNLKLINESVMMLEGYEQQPSESILLKPHMDYEDLDYSDIYNRDIFSVVKVDTNLTKIHEGDTIIICRDITYYVYLDGIKYFMINGMNNIEGKLN